MSNSEFDPRAFRQALGSFATGVTIITTRTADGEAMGLTVNSFNSVSLDPPMVLWSLAESYRGYEQFRKATHWAVHVLAADQEELSNRFAGKVEDKFAGLALEDGIEGTPLLPGCAARFQCRTAFQYEGGDHLIFVGEVESFEQNANPPLVFHGGRYAHATHRQPQDEPRHPYLAGSFDENFLGYLLGRGHFRFYSQINPHLEEARLSDEEFYLLSTLTLKQTMTALELDKAMAGILNTSSSAAIQSLISRGLARPEHLNLDDEDAPPVLAFELTADGRKLALRLISAAKVVESQVNERLGYADSSVLKALLIRLLDAIDPNARTLWNSEDEAP